MEEELRPDPEALLRAAKKEESREKGGSLKIFLGMSAGVGKTYAMLESAIQAQAEGIDVAVGIVDTHGREETKKLLQGLSQVPMKQLEYKGTVFDEFDLDKVLKLKPKLVLVDELAHTNVPGSRHPKRWQDVLELLDAGIDVYTTLNIQHIESRKDLVENITGIRIHETVPDSIVERANDIELVDITPVHLLKRLREGKVYLGPQSEIALHHFFKEDSLTALRELSLRFTAEKVDHDLHEMIGAKERKRPWRTAEKLLVCVSHSPHSLHLIRTGRRLAFNLDASWIALHIDDGKELSDQDKATLAKNMALAQELGAEVLSIADTDIARAVQRVAKQKKVTQIIIGRSVNRSVKDYFTRDRLLNRLVKESSDIDIHVMHDHVYLKQAPRLSREFAFSGRIAPYLQILTCVIAMTLFSSLIVPYVGYRLIGLIYFIAILIYGLFFPAGPVLLASVISAFSMSTYFIPPGGTYEITAQENFIWFTGFFATGVVIGMLTSRLREREKLLLNRDESTQAIYEIVREIASAPSTPVLLLAVKERLGMVLDGACEIILKTIDNGLNLDTAPLFLREEKELAVATWVFDKGKEAGWSTDTLPGVKNLYIPLQGFYEIVGVLTYQPKNIQKTLSQQEKNLLYTVGKQLANYIERSYAEEKARKNAYMQQVEKVYQTILRSITSEFQSPLGSMKEGLKKLKKEESEIASKIGDISLNYIENSADSIGKITDHISAMSTLCSGLVNLKREKNSIKDLLEVCVANIMRTHDKHLIKLHIESNLPQIPFDFSLMEILMYNILFNSIEYSPDATTIQIEAKKEGEHLLVRVRDEGRSSAVSGQPQLLEKFYRLPGSPSSSLGLGLAIAQSIAEIHQGDLLVRSHEQGGTEFVLTLPLAEPI